MTDNAKKERDDKLKNAPVQELIHRWQQDYIEKLKELQKLRFDFRKYQAEVNEEMNSLLIALLDALDEYDKMLGSLQKALSEEDKKAKRVVKNFTSIRKKFSVLTKRFGLKPIDSGTSEFIPGLHKAVGVENDPTIPQGHIISVERRGYFWKNNILRPAEVIVSTGKNIIQESSRE